MPSLCLVFAAVLMAAALAPRVAHGEHRGPAGERGALDLWESYRLVDDPEELRRTWERAEIRVPGRLVGPDASPIFGMIGAGYVQERLEALPRDASFPLVVFLHGCNGIGLVEQKLGRLADRAGFVTLLTNSFARNLRQPNCNYSTYQAGMFPQAYLYRRAELIYALERVRALSWVDQDRIVLGGFSEGAVATALWGGEVDVSGYVVAGWTCTAPESYRWLNGLRTPKDKPVLAIVSRRDRWFDWPGWRGDCASISPDRDDVVSLVIDGAVHNVFAYPEGSEALVTFLRRLGSPK